MRLRIAFASTLAVLACSGSDVAPTQEDSSPKNHRPTMVELPDTSASVGSTLRLKVSATDPDGDELSFHGAIGSSLSDVRRGTLPVFRFTSSETTLVFWPQAYDKPGRTAILWAEDRRGGVDTMTVQVIVN